MALRWTKRRVMVCATVTHRFGRAFRIGALLFTAHMLAAPGAEAVRLTNKRVAKLREALFGPDLKQAQEAVKVLVAARSSKADALLLRSLQMGAPPPLLFQLLDALRVRKPASALDLLRHYASYRDARVRVAALTAVNALPQKEVVGVLIDALDDSSESVRKRAAELLGQRRERRAERMMLRLLRKGDMFVAGPLGSVASADTATALADLLGELPATTITEAFGAMLRRADFGPDPLRVKIVRALGQFSEVEATTVLLEYIASVPSGETRLSKTIAEQLLAGRAQ
jgi:HEAT repeat protein